MKFIKLILFFVLLINSGLCLAQKDSLNLILEYLPNKTYSMYSETSFSVENTKIKNKNISESEMTKDTLIITTGELSNNSFSFSLKMAYKNSPKKIEIKGICSPNEYPKLSFIIPSLDNYEMEQTFLLSGQEALKDKIPIFSKKLKTGESFTTRSVIKVPIMGSPPMEMTVMTYYTLTEIKSNYAYLSYDKKIILDTKIEEAKISGSGKGSGKLTYNINNHFFTSNKSNETILDMKVSAKGKSIPIKMKIKSSENTVIK